MDMLTYEKATKILDKIELAKGVLKKFENETFSVQKVIPDINEQIRKKIKEYEQEFENLTMDE